MRATESREHSLISGSSADFIAPSANQIYNGQTAKARAHRPTDPIRLFFTLVFVFALSALLAGIAAGDTIKADIGNSIPNHACSTAATMNCPSFEPHLQATRERNHRFFAYAVIPHSSSDAGQTGLEFQQMATYPAEPISGSPGNSGVSHEGSSPSGAAKLPGHDDSRPDRDDGTASTSNDAAGLGFPVDDFYPLLPAAGIFIYDSQLESLLLTRPVSTAAVALGEFPSEDSWGAAGGYSGSAASDDLNRTFWFMPLPRVVISPVERIPPDPPDGDGGKVTPTLSTVKPVPEPASMGLVLLGTAFVLGLEWKRF